MPWLLEDRRVTSAPMHIQGHSWTCYINAYPAIGFDAHPLDDPICSIHLTENKTASTTPLLVENVGFATTVVFVPFEVDALPMAGPIAPSGFG